MILFLGIAFATHFHFTSGQCVESITEVNGRKSCKGQQIFYENFDSIDPRIWRHEELIPWEPDYEFSYFDKSPDTSYLETGKLVIKPKLVDDEFVTSGELTLSNCTGKLTQECKKKAVSYNIIPPVRSARLTTINSFSFKYGQIDIRSKLPGGDWIIPELRLMPKQEAYGPFYESGMISIASSKGNRYLRSANNREIGATALSGGMYLSSSSKNYKVRSRVFSLQNGNEPWYTRYHTFSILWTPDTLQASVDGKVVADLIPPQFSGTIPILMGFSSEEASKWSQGSKIAPFDKEMYISIGVSVGGTREFKDGVMSGTNEKPWKNLSPKNMANFWKDKNIWSNSWTSALTKMEIQKITVKAV